MNAIRQWTEREDLFFTKVFRCLLDNGDDDTANEIKQDFYLWLLAKPHIFAREHSNLRSFLGGMAKRFYLNWIDKQNRGNVGLNNRMLPLEVETQDGLYFNGEEIVDGFNDTINPIVAKQIAWNWMHQPDGSHYADAIDKMLVKLQDYDEQYRSEGTGLIDLLLLLQDGFTGEQIQDMWQLDKSRYSRLLKTLRKIAVESGFKSA